MSRFVGLVLAVSASLFLAGCGSGSGIRVKDTTRTFRTVVVDAGHGGNDNGASRRYGGAEKTATLDVATRLERKLRESEFKTVMTRSDDTFVSLDKRAAISNRQKNAIFVSIHFNDSRRRGHPRNRDLLPFARRPSARLSHSAAIDDPARRHQSRREDRKFSRAAKSPISRRAGRVRISQQSQRRRESPERQSIATNWPTRLPRRSWTSDTAKELIIRRRPPRMRLRPRSEHGE